VLEGLPEGYSSLTGNGSAPGGRIQRESAGLQAGFRIRIRISIGSGFNRVSGSGSVFGIRIQEGKNHDKQKKKKFKKFHVLK
jgi:hypothetical protein